MSDIEATYIITGDTAEAIVCDKYDEPIEFTDAEQAIERGREELAKLGDDSEVWVWRLSHVLYRTSDIEVEEVL
jgi:hypothetical protein